MRKTLLPLFAVGILAGCAGVAPRPGVETPKTPAVAKEPAATPAPANADWQILGVSPNGNVLNELDKLSIQRQGNMATFRDRKTIFNLKKENFLSTPPHKVSINQWQVDCAARTFRLQQMMLFDENGRQIASFTYNDAQIKAMPVVQNTASYQQMQLACQGVAGF